MSDLQPALDVALQAAAVARTISAGGMRPPRRPARRDRPLPGRRRGGARHPRLPAQAFPTWGFLGEETARQPEQDDDQPTWFVDPNDGTTTMQRGYRGHAVSIGLVRDGAPVLGVVCAVDAPDDDGDLISWAEGCGPIAPQRHSTSRRVTWCRHLGPQDVVGLSQAGESQSGRLPGVRRAGAVRQHAEHRLSTGAGRRRRVRRDGLAQLSEPVGLSPPAMPWCAPPAASLVDEHGQRITLLRRRTAARPTQIFAVVTRASCRISSTAPGQAPSRSGFGDAAPPPDVAPVRAQVGKLVHDPGVLQRAQGCLLGQLAGDALGALVEFQSADRIAAAYPDGGPRQLADGGPHRIIAGQPTDDSELALVLARSLVAARGFDQEAVARAYAGWYHGWTHTLEPQACAHRWCRPFDVGSTTAQALGRDPRRRRATRSGGRQRARRCGQQHSQANGALMRISPLGIWGAFRDPAAVAAAARDGRAAYPSARGVPGRVGPVRGDARGRDPRRPESAPDLRVTRSPGYVNTADDAGLVRRRSSARTAGPPGDYLSQQGWVLIALQNAFFQLLQPPDTRRRRWWPRSAQGGDTDTNAAICGALLGAVHGRAAVPAQWQRMVLSCRPMPGAARTCTSRDPPSTGRPTRSYSPNVCFWCDFRHFQSKFRPHLVHSGAMCGSHLDSDAMSSATFSFLFTDIVGSTEHVVRLGDERWDALLTRYRADRSSCAAALQGSRSRRCR